MSHRTRTFIDSVDSGLTHLGNNLRLDYGQASSSGIKDKNDDCLGIRVPTESVLITKGAVAAIADGVSAAIAGREAAEICIQGLLNDYYDTPEAWSVKKSGLKNYTSLNRWLYSLGQAGGDLSKGYVTTLSTLFLKSNRAYIFHVGDSRIYRLRGKQLEQITRDHAACVGDHTQLTRAMGFDTNLDVDFHTMDLYQGDIFFLSTDGLHEFVTDKQISDAIIRYEIDWDTCCEGLIQQALKNGSNDNLSCQIVEIKELKKPTSEDVFKRLNRLPFPPDLSVGMVLDGLLVEKVILESPRSQVYLVKDQENGEKYALKTPSVNFEDDISYIERFVMESWIGKQVKSLHVVKVIDRGRQQNFLYNLFEYIEGPTLEQWIEKNPKPNVESVLNILNQVTLGLRAMHRKEILHQDLKPGNIVLTENKGAVIIDFGSSRVAGIEEIFSAYEKESLLGTIHFTAPEYKLNRKIDNTVDIFSMATIAYQMFTGGKLPYGEAFEKAHDLKDFSLLRYTPSYQYNPMIPIWIDGALKKGVSVNQANRYQALSHMEFDLSHPNSDFIIQEPMPLLHNRSYRFWKITAATLFCLEMATLYFFLLRN